MLGGGGRAVVGEAGYSKRISLNKNPNVKKKCGGGWRKFFLYESKFKIIPGGWKRRGWDMARVSDCFLFF